MSGRRTIELPEDASWPELCQACVELAKVGGSRFPLELVKAADRIGAASSGAAVDELLAELVKRFGAPIYDAPVEREVIEWLRSR